MSLDNVFYPYVLRLPSPELTHLTEVSPSRNQNVIFERQAGNPAPCFVGVSFTDPSMTFSSRALKPVLDTIVGGVENIVRNLSAGDVELWYRAGRAMEIREDAGDTRHTVARLIQSAMMFWTDINVTNGEVATVRAQISTAVRSAASTTMLWLGDQQLPGRSGCDRIYGMGPAFLNGVKLEGVTGFNVTSNVVQEPVSADGIPANCYQGIREYHVQATLNSHDIRELHETLAEPKLGGEEYDLLELYLQRMVNTNTYAPADDPSHIRITLNGGLKTVDGANGIPVQTVPTFYTEEELGVPTHQFNTSVTIPP